VIVDFEIQLARVSGKIRAFDKGDQFSRRFNSLMYYSNYADELHEAALLVGNAKLIPGNVFCLLAGLSIELLLKGILLGLQGKFPKSHQIQDLSLLSGISSTDDDLIILQSMSEYVSWASKYPTPKDEQSWHSAVELFGKQRRTSGKLSSYIISEREINMDNYERFWEKYANCFWQVYEVVH